MAVVKVYDQDKTEQGELTLTPEVFEVAVRPEILHLVVRAQLAAKRAGTHSTKTSLKFPAAAALPTPPYLPLRSPNPRWFPSMLHSPLQHLQALRQAKNSRLQ